MKIIKSLYINHRFFYLLMSVGGLYFLSFIVHWLLPICNYLIIFLLLVTAIEFFLLYIDHEQLIGERTLPDRLSNGDLNEIVIFVKNRSNLSLNLKLIDEIPFHFQKRDFLIQTILNAKEEKSISYQLKPTKRGVYQFGNLNIFATSRLGLISRRYSFGENMEVATYPSFVQLRKYDLMAFSNHLTEFGLKRIRRIGHTMEFEQIKEYGQGDDIRTINWKATSKRNNLMVNQFQDEKAQSIYQVIDTGRVMRMPFCELSLLDYSINSTLALSNIILKKQDKAGMLTFSKKIENIVVAERRSGQIQRLMDTLYRIETDFIESDFSRLYIELRKVITQRSMIMLYTNFETLDGLHRQLPYIKEIARRHLLIVVFFENTEITQLIHRPAKSVQEIYDKVIAEKFAYEKRLIVRELRKHGIQTILTKPEDLTIEAINKYLELKARGMI